MSREVIREVLDKSIYRMEITDPTVVWFSERLDWVVDRLIESGVTVKKYGAWKPLGHVAYEDGRRYTHYCSLCLTRGYDDMHFCSGCGADMGFEIEEPIKEILPEL